MHKRDGRSVRVVPYNMYLLKRFCAHINVEVAAAVKIVGYLFKYICKGSETATCSWWLMASSRAMKLMTLENSSRLSTLAPVRQRGGSWGSTARKSRLLWNICLCTSQGWCEWWLMRRKLMSIRHQT